MRTITSLGSFAVKNDGSEDFKTYVLEPLNKIWQLPITDKEGYYGIFVLGNTEVVPAYWYSNETPDVPILTVSEVKEFLSGTGEEKDLLASVPNDSSPVVSHPSASGNSDEQWISVKERMPDVEEGHAEEVIINSYVKGAEKENCVLCGVFYNGKFYVATEWNGEYNDEETIVPIPAGRISHWRELPQPPKS